MKFLNKFGEKIEIPLEYCPKCWLGDQAENEDFQVQVKQKLEFETYRLGKESGDQVEKWVCSRCAHEQWRAVGEWSEAAMQELLARTAASGKSGR